MDQDVSTFTYPTSTTQEDMTFPPGIAAQSTFDSWGADSYSQMMQVDWLSPNYVPYTTSGPGYPAVLQSLYSGPLPSEQNGCSTPRCQPQSGFLTPTYPSQTHVPASSPMPTQQAFDALVPVDGSSEPRPQSAGTMVDSGSSNESRQSSISGSPISRGLKFKVPAIQTHFHDQNLNVDVNGNSIGDGIQVADIESMTAMSNEWMQGHGMSDQDSIHDSALSAATMKSSPALLEPFQWHSSVSSRRESMSSAASGPVFSPFGTPTSAAWQHSTMNSPYGPQNNWTPVSASGRMPPSPQSPYNQRGYRTWSRGQYAQAIRQNKHLSPSMSLPGRNKPRLMRGISDSYAILPGMLPSQARVRTTEHKRARIEATSHLPSTSPQQQGLPEFQLGALFAAPEPTQSEFRRLTEIHTPPRNILPSSTTHTPMGPPQTTPRVTLTPNFGSLQLATPYASTQPFPTLPTNVPITSSNVNSIPTPAHQPPLPTPSEPPLSDFLVNSTASNGSSSSPAHNHLPACGPIRQSPHFEGDIYTPRFKRRNAAGKWEGWCGYCQPGRWLDLKNSRYWEDKLRNHGICARTKTFFEGPLRVRWVSDRGTVWEGEAGDSGFDIAGREGLDDDGVGRKREGLCGECDAWVAMDGMRSRGKGRCVAWWMHAYKCHEQSKSRTDGTGTFDKA